MRSSVYFENNYAPIKLFLLEQFGYNHFRKDQLPIIISLLKQNDTLALLPTGAGKSLCYQFPTAFTKTRTLVISPLIALMEDQVRSAMDKGIEAWLLSSSNSYSLNQQNLQEFSDAESGILFVSPERVQSEWFIDQLSQIKIDLIAVDEAHCISQWGHDFRPGYRNIQKLRNNFKSACWLALTATATLKVISDICDVLDLENVNIIRQSYVRKNISFVVIKSNNPYTYLLQEISKSDSSIIVYCRNRIKTEDVASFLSTHKISASAYHAGMSPEQKKTVSNDWMCDHIKVIVATNAFGMGIDKPNVGCVIHLDIPPSLEEYYQEAGRAGRNGLPSKALMLLPENEGKRSLDKSAKYHISSFQIQQLIALINECYQTGNIKFINPIYNLKKITNLHPLKIMQGLKILENSGYVELSEGTNNPSRLRFNKEKAKSINFSAQHQLAYQLADYCLKRYENLFNSWVIIDENEIADHLNLEIPKIIEQFELLEKEEIITYGPAAGPKYLTITKKLNYDDEIIQRIEYQDIKQEQLNQVIRYYKSKDCRMQTLLRYFDESIDPCEKCDICLNKRKINKISTFDHYLNKLMTEREVFIHSILDNPYLSKEKTLQRLQFLAIEKHIKIQGHKIVKNS